MTDAIRKQLEAAGVPQVQRKGKKRTTTSAQPNEAAEPKEKHVRLPPPPDECGPWLVGGWRLHRTTTYEPQARVVLTGPAADFDRLLAYLQAFPNILSVTT